jgi:hypothetical protein
MTKGPPHVWLDGRSTERFIGIKIVSSVSAGENTTVEMVSLLPA